MLDIRQLRSDPQGVAANLARRGYAFDLAQFTDLEVRRKQAQVAVDALRNERNTRSKAIGHAKGKGEDVTPLLAEVESLGGKLAEGEQGLATLQGELDRLLLDLPNTIHDSVPNGRDASANVEVRRHGEPPKLAFAAADHVAIAERLGGLDSAAAGRLSGARFAVLTGPVASLHRALAQFMLDLHLREHGYREAWVPYLVSRKTLTGTGQLPKFEQDLFKLERGPAEGELFLIPTAEVPLTNLASERIFEPAELPLRLVAHTPCFRSEAGSYGKDTRGLIRQHQFDKVELVQVVRPADSYAALEALDGSRRPGARATRVALPRHGALLGRHRLRERENLRPRSLAPGAGRLSRDLLLQQLRGLPGAAHAGALAQSRDRQAGTGAHAERIGCCRRTGARRRARKRPAGGRKRRPARSPASLSRGRRAPQARVISRRRPCRAGAGGS